MKASEDRYAQLAARLLAPQNAAEIPVPADNGRDAIVAAMALAIAARRRRRRAFVAAGVVVAAAAAVLLAVLARNGSHSTTGAAPWALKVERASGSTALLLRGTSMQALGDQQPLLAGDLVRAGDSGSTMLATAAGTRLRLAPEAELRVDQLAPAWRFSLQRGEVQAHVAKLRADERFVVRIPEGEVEVRGTVFQVVVAPTAGNCAQGARSTVAVSEGLVAVRSAEQEVLLHPGESWSAPCEVRTETAPPLPSPANTAAPATRRPAARHEGTPRASAIPAVAPEPTPVQPTLSDPVSHLGEQNDLFSAAMAAERAGRHDLALRQLDTLLARFPRGPLAESARAERIRIISAQPSR